MGAAVPSTTLQLQLRTQESAAALHLDCSLSLVAALIAMSPFAAAAARSPL